MSGELADATDPAQVGVVVIGRNEGQRLADCFASLIGDDRRIVYVDSGSTDDSLLLCQRLGIMAVELDMSLGFTAARARNAGFAELMRLAPESRYVQFLDGDCSIDPDWIATATAFLETHPKAAIVCGRRRERFPDASIYNAMCDVEWNTPIGPASACGGDFLIRAQAFRQVGGFLPQLIAGEEPEMCIRLREVGWTIHRIDHEMTAHDAAIDTFGQWWRRSVRAGHAYGQIETLHRKSSQRMWQRNVLRAVLWAGLLPATVVASIATTPALLAVLLAYPLQVVRLAFQRKNRSSNAAKEAGLLMIGKFAEAQGILKFYLGRLRRRPSAIIEYK